MNNFNLLSVCMRVHLFFFIIKIRKDANSL